MAMKCVKCLSSDVWTHWHQSRYDCGFYPKPKFDGEHLHYGCRNCSYEWHGPTADKDSIPALAERTPESQNK